MQGFYCVVQHIFSKMYNINLRISKIICNFAAELKPEGIPSDKFQ